MGPDHDATIRDFQAKLQEYTMQATCGRDYVLVAKLKQWMKSQVGSTTQASRLLAFAYRNRNDPGLPVSVERISDGENSCLIVFSILLVLNWGGLVDFFLRRGIVDKQLPIDLLALRELRKADLGSIDRDKLVVDFEAIQWRFCAAKFDLGMGRDFVKNMIIPICRKKPINHKGGTAKLWEIEVQEEFVGDTLRKTVLNSGYNDTKDRFGYRYQFALKSFGEGNRSLYTNEKNAFYGLRKHEGMIRYLADYGHQEIRPSPNSSRIKVPDVSEETTETTYNILLEFGERDLDEYFIDRLPPVLPTEIEAFWKALFEVADAVEGIHNLEINTDGVVQEYHGWHADIKPDNILIVQGKFKLADPGFAKFVKKTNNVPTEFMLGGTKTYGAPERHPARKGTQIAVPQTIDTWSLGCVFSIAATWVALGHQGISQHKKMREKAMKKIIQGQSSQTSTGKAKLALNEGDFFHDGRQVLPDVKSWHEFLRKTLRKTDTITSKVIDLVDQKMLLGNAAERINAKDICAELTEITARSQQEPRESMPESIMKALLEVDEEAPSQSVGSASHEALSEKSRSVTDSDDRKARKSKLLDRPLMKTTHRSEYLKSALAAQNVEPGTSSGLYNGAAETSPVSHNTWLKSSPSHHSQDPTQMSDPRILQNNHFQRGLSDGSIATAPARPKQPKKTNATQSVFQAREEIEKREKGNYFKRTRKDILLTRHFSNRDIKFLVDNAETMQPFWYEANYLLETLVMKSSGQDEDGMDLRFTAGPVKVDNKKEKSAFTKAMKDPNAQPTKGMHTDMRKPLGDIFNRHLEDLETQKKFSPRKKVKNLTLIVFTDGIWAGMRNKDDVKNKIVGFVKLVEEKYENLIDRPVSIEFIRFGNDADASYRLRSLDNDLKWEGIPDIIDTEPSSGDVNKMLLGSFVEEFDEVDDDEIAAPGSPDQRIGAGEALQRTGGPSRVPTRAPTRAPTGASNFQPFFADQNLHTTSP